MKLPHLAPLVFAKEILKKTDNSSEVLCEFKQIPTFGMFVDVKFHHVVPFQKQYLETHLVKS